MAQSKYCNCSRLLLLEILKTTEEKGNDNSERIQNYGDWLKKKRC